MSSYDHEHRDKYDIRLYQLKMALAKGEISKARFDVEKRHLDEMAGFSVRGTPQSGSPKVPRWGPISDFFAGSLRPLGKDEASEEPGEDEPEPPPQLIYPPGFMAERVLRFLLPKKDYEDIFDPALTDMRIAYCDAISENEETKAKWISCREHIRIIWVLAIYIGFATWTRQIKKLMKSINAPKGDDQNDEDE